MKPSPPKAYAVLTCDGATCVHRQGQRAVVVVITSAPEGRAAAVGARALGWLVDPERNHCLCPACAAALPVVATAQ